MPEPEPPQIAAGEALAQPRQASVGWQLRERRRSLNLTLDDVAVKAGLTKGYLSQVERDLASPSVAALLAICHAVGTGIGELFDSPNSHVVRRDERVPIQFGGTGIDEYLLSPSPRSRLQVIRSELGPEATGGPDTWSLPAEEEFVLVLHGKLVVEVAEIEHELAAGDALTFDPRQPHRFWNPSDSDEAHAVFVVTPSPYA
ncbi:MAG: helix-turn-helix domain-containing protein [Solirubrobacterales bacterium]